MMGPTTEPTTEAATERTLTDILGELNSARTQAANLAHHVAYVAKWEAVLKAELRESMEAAGIKTGEGHGLQAQLKTRKSNVVTDVTELTSSLSEAGILGDFLILDKTSAAKYAAKNDLPGVGIQETTFLAIVEVK